MSAEIPEPQIMNDAQPVGGVETASPEIISSVPGVIPTEAVATDAASPPDTYHGGYAGARPHTETAIGLPQGITIEQARANIANGAPEANLPQ